MGENLLVDLSKQFAIDTINLCTEIQNNLKNYVLANQLLRSGTSVGANIHEANYASSRADFINKLQIALKECYESEYWLDIFKETNIITKEKYESMFLQCSKIRKLLVSSINTAKKNQQKRAIDNIMPRSGNSCASNSRSEARIHDGETVNLLY